MWSYWDAARDETMACNIAPCPAVLAAASEWRMARSRKSQSVQWQSNVSVSATAPSNRSA